MMVLVLRKNFPPSIDGWKREYISTVGDLDLVVGFFARIFVIPCVPDEYLLLDSWFVTTSLS